MSEAIGNKRRRAPSDKLDQIITEVRSMADAVKSLSATISGVDGRLCNLEKEIRLSSSRSSLASPASAFASPTPEPALVTTLPSPPTQVPKVGVLLNVMLCGCTAHSRDQGLGSQVKHLKAESDISTLDVDKCLYPSTVIKSVLHSLGNARDMEFRQLRTACTRYGAVDVEPKRNEALQTTSSVLVAKLASVPGATQEAKAQQRSRIALFGLDMASLFTRRLANMSAAPAEHEIRIMWERAPVAPFAYLVGHFCSDSDPSVFHGVSWTLKCSNIAACCWMWRELFMLPCTSRRSSVRGLMPETIPFYHLQS